MIQLLANRYAQAIAAVLFNVFLASLLPFSGNAQTSDMFSVQGNDYQPFFHTNYSPGMPTTVDKLSIAEPVSTNSPDKSKSEKKPVKVLTLVTKPAQTDIGGPGQPEMSSFKPAGSDNLVNLFTGDFSYNIPLLDVGGYPVNIFYDGGVSMEQEASWVGLGWNINPGNINRNMRGIPDDFNGEEQLTQYQDMKPNRNWGFNVSDDIEVVGIKAFDAFKGSIGLSLGVSFNNYLGPALDFGIKGATTLQIAGVTKAEKSASLNLSGSLGLNLNSRNGFSTSGGLSLSAKSGTDDKNQSFGLGLSTGYNSRVGIKSLQLSGQMSFNTSKASETGGNPTNFSQGASLFSSSITFNKPSYIPALRLPVTNTAWAGRLQLGGGIFGVYISGEIEVFRQQSEIVYEDKLQIKPMIGYLHTEKAMDNSNAVMDFARFNDNQVMPATPIISAPQYSYDVFSIQGEGTGGTVRAYRNDHGYVRDNQTHSRDKSFAVGGDWGPVGHFGGNFNIVQTPSYIGEWRHGNLLKDVVKFSTANGLSENVYFRNPGETSVLDDGQFDKIGGADLVRYKLGASDISPTVLPILEKFSKTNQLIGTADMKLKDPVARKKRTQVTSFLTAEEAQIAGLDKKIKSYDPIAILDADKNLKYIDIPRVDVSTTNPIRRKHHISQVNITEADGKRYVYGIPVYNITQKDFTFTVNSNTESGIDQVTFTSSEPTTINSQKDGYLQTTTTPAYAHSFLLSGLLSPDYVDVDGDGITENDLGNAVKFNYSKFNNHKWRTPLPANIANFNQGNRTEPRDDKGLISYGERESWYLHSVESKTMMAIFTVEDRQDGKGVTSELAGVDAADKSIKQLKKIDLYNKADLKKNGITNAKPVKTVWFEYDYTLCKGTPDNTTAGAGKLALNSIYFTYNGKPRANKNRYIFAYTTSTGTGNPNYETNATDRWGNYKPRSENPSLPGGTAKLKNSDFPYTIQDKAKKATIDQNAAPWALKRILLPSGGQIQVDYETDDYAFVQNKRAAAMMQIAGAGTTSTSFSNKLYGTDILAGGRVAFGEYYYVFIKVPESCANAQEVYQKYLIGLTQLAFKMKIKMPLGEEYINCYGEIDGNNYGRYDNAHIWVKLKPVNDHSPLVVAAVNYLREQLPGQAYPPGYDLQGEMPLIQVASMLGGLLNSLTEAFRDPLMYQLSKNRARAFSPEQSFVRLNDPDGYKYGGGNRVKTVTMKDNWDKMTQQYASTYGKKYGYETTEIFNGAERTISSGVASYEPSIGGEENPFQSLVMVSDKLPLGPTSFASIEMPVLDAFFPAATVGYSKVTVTSMNKLSIPVNKKSRSGIGKQVTEFFTAKDFPVYYNHTPFDKYSDQQVHIPSVGAFFFTFSFDVRTLSQGFLVETNDMHGKMKSQSSYAENDPTTRINYTENFYRNTGAKGLGEKFEFVHGGLGGVVKEGNMGIDIELMTDTREFIVESNSLEVQAQLDLFPVIFPFIIPFIWPVLSMSHDAYRAVTTTKHISYHSVVDSVVVIDKGSHVSTKNLSYDAETGEVVLSRTNNEFDQYVYNINYPAYWAYSGMGPAYKNIDAIYNTISFKDGKIVSGIATTELKNIFESGDELLVIDKGTATEGCDPNMVSIDEKTLIWAVDKNKNNSSLTNLTPDFLFMDDRGKLYNRSSVSCRIVRSGKRNLLGASIAAISSMNDPRITTSGVKKLVIDNAIAAASANKVINASALEYKEKWQADNDLFKRKKMVPVMPYRAQGPELVTNGNFASGNTGFYSDYKYSPASYSADTGSYRVTTTPANWTPHTNFANCSDCNIGSSSPRNFLQIDGGTIPNEIWFTTVPIEPQRTYRFSAYITNFNDQYQTTLGRIQFVIGGGNKGSIFSAEATRCVWKNVSVDWYSGDKTSVQVAIINRGVETYGSDYGIDNISFYALQEGSCDSIEIEDCAGYLEKSINPYRKGLLGNFTTHRSMVFYEGRVEKDPLAQTKLLQDGYLSNFRPYWNFNSAANMVQDDANTRWVWNTEITRLNAKGQELETRDALNIYTAAQYGYKKTSPIAIANNSRSQEMFYEGFEDADYNDLLNTSAYNKCGKKHIDFATNNILTLASNPHSGEKALQVNAGTLPITIPVNNTNTVATGFQAQFPVDTIKGLSEPGININNIWSIPYNSVGPEPSITASDGSISIQPLRDTMTYFNNTHTRFFEYSVSASQYYQVEDDGVYEIKTLVFGRNELPNYTHQLHISFFITDLAGNHISSGSSTYIGCFKKGIYKIVWYCEGNMSHTCTESNHIDGEKCYQGQQDIPTGRFAFSFRNTGYKTLASQPVCTYSKPLAATVEMQNPTFSIPAGKKMLFSAWVKEGNTNVPAYTNNEVQVDFGSGNAANATLRPAGPIIGGWQRYEGYFTAPVDATSMNLKLVNKGSTPIYFDDIRIHPFNANMKSYVYDPITLRLTAELDANNYTKFYEYDEEGGLIRTKAETKEGIKTINETRSFRQRTITAIQ